MRSVFFAKMGGVLCRAWDSEVPRQASMMQI
jgi:hypothetical protein